MREESPQVSRQVGRGCITPGLLLGHRLQADRLEIARDAIVEHAQGTRFAALDLLDQHGLVAAERPIAGQELVEHDAQTVDVAASVDAVALAAGLLGAHVGRRSQQLADPGHGDLIAVSLGQSEIHHVGAPVDADHDVRRLDVAVNDAMNMRIIECVGDLGDQSGRFDRRVPCMLDPLRQRDAADQLADDERQAVMFADLVDRHDGRVTELGHAPRFSQEAIDLAPAGEVAGPEHLERDNSVELGVACPVDGAEAAEAQHREQVEAAHGPLAKLCGRRV